MSDNLNIAANRAARKWSRKELIGRVLWGICTPLFRMSPRIFWGWRRGMLRLFGGTIGKNVQIHPSVTIFIPWNLKIDDWSSIGFEALVYNLGELRIGKNVTISQRAHLCGGTHDHRDRSMPLEKMPIEIGSNAWICADAFIGPGVTVCEGAVVAARAVVVRHVDTDQIVGGNPAKLIGMREFRN